jgi:hypothetical protein
MDKNVNKKWKVKKCNVSNYKVEREKGGNFNYLMMHFNCF